MIDSLVHVATNMEDNEKRYELMLKSLQLFVQQGIEAKKASERAEVFGSQKVSRWEGENGSVFL